MRSLGVTGTRGGMTAPQLRAVLAFYRQHHPIYLHHGDCIGADAEMHEVATAFATSITIHPPDVAKYRAWCDSKYINKPLPYRERNQAIVKAADTLLVLPSGTMKKQPRSGTWMTYRIARTQGVRCVVIHPDGEMEVKERDLFPIIHEKK